ncbi:hypothetical protein ABOM_000413 [Aspergillus bombycis]|uniref:Uncharacterized protein n=1 Tax=Aspergillus bombycis TaxID=109264 RepID=A0A1F8AHG2_9EURO|nr:hypothetical protein ABOM_000413 [Aspergillus bombycis]OGM51092.1 hypothetical protein ABOM_000413 [Aspergillus bombycis]
MRQIIGILVLMLMQVLAVTWQQQPTSSTSAMTPNPTICGEIVNNEEVSIFDASQAYKCLTSLPFHADIASQLVQYLNDIVQFHSTLAYLADPPQSYQQPAVDLVAGLSQLQRDIDDNIFRNEYAFETALNHLIHAAHDDHLTLVGGALSRFTYAAPYSIVSVSLDGVELPKVYISDDLFANETGCLHWQPSAIATVNGQDVVEYLMQFASVNSIGKLEPHADWNMLMRSAALDIQGKREVFHGAATSYPGDFITFTFENGTTLGPLPWKASFCCQEGNGSLQTMDDFYNLFVLGGYPASSDESLAASTTTISKRGVVISSNTSTPKLTPFENPAYPSKADVIEASYTRNGGSLLRGYFLHDASLAVLSIPHFVAATDAPQSFSNTVKKFLARSTNAGLKKVVIDVQQNPGGSPLLVLEVFKIFFPSITPWASSRRRVHPMANALGSVLTTYWQNLTMDHPEYHKLIANEWVVTGRLDLDTGRNFTSWDDFVGPADHYRGDGFTKKASIQTQSFYPEQYNLSSTLFTMGAAGIEIDDHDDGQPYKPEDIIILSDGLCSSACALFMELMHHEAGVRTVVIGGQPSYGPMQAPSGTRGAAVYKAEDIHEDIGLARGIDKSAHVDLPNRAHVFFINTATVNLRDQVRHTDTSATPLQFLYEAADCRIFLVPETWYNYTNLWKYAAGAIWQNPALCAKGSRTEHTQPTHPSVPGKPYTASSVLSNLADSQSDEHPQSIQDKSNFIQDAAERSRNHLGKPCWDKEDCDLGGSCSCKAVMVCVHQVIYKNQKFEDIYEPELRKLCVSDCMLNTPCPDSTRPRCQTLHSDPRGKLRFGYCGPPKGPCTSPQAQAPVIAYRGEGEGTCYGTKDTLTCYDSKNVTKSRMVNVHPQIYSPDALVHYRDETTGERNCCCRARNRVCTGTSNLQCTPTNSEPVCVCSDKTLQCPVHL